MTDAQRQRIKDFVHDPNWGRATGIHEDTLMDVLCDFAEVVFGDELRAAAHSPKETLVEQSEDAALPDGRWIPDRKPNPYRHPRINDNLAEAIASRDEWETLFNEAWDYLNNAHDPDCPSSEDLENECTCGVLDLFERARHEYARMCGMKTTVAFNQPVRERPTPPTNL